MRGAVRLYPGVVVPPAASLCGVTFRWPAGINVSNSVLWDLERMAAGRRAHFNVLLSKECKVLHRLFGGWSVEHANTSTGMADR